MTPHLQYRRCRRELQVNEILRISLLARPTKLIIAGHSDVGLLIYESETTNPV
jgi:hypothetical protein